MIKVLKSKCRGGGRTLSSNKGFTLAEVLVTLGIIGVVSVMTVPSLMQNHQRKTYATQLHQVYSMLQQAFLQYMNDKNALNLKEAGLTTFSDVNDFMNSYFKIVKTCSNFKDCFYSGNYKNINGVVIPNNNYWYGNIKVPCFVLASGAAVCVEHAIVHSTFAHITIDINGPKGPNVAGRDLFFVSFYSDGSIDEEGIPPECRQLGQGCSLGKKSAQEVRSSLGASCKSNQYAKGCLGLIINNNWEMDY